MLRRWMGVCCMLLGVTSALQANHIMGVDLTYTCINSCTVRLHVRGYRDCAGAMGVPNSVTFQATTPGCGSPPALTNWLSDTMEITPLCTSAVSMCEDRNSPVNGVEEYYFYRDYDICAVQGCNYTIVWGTCCRNGAITSGSSGQPIFISQTTLNTSLGTCNSSPQFSSLPIPYVCAGQPNVFNQGAVDPEGDSLSYALGPCFQNSTGTTLIYSPGFSPSQPLGPSWNVSINPSTGDITVLPTPGNVEVGVICVNVTEWRNGVAINTIVRDMQMTVINCPNILPTVPALTNATSGSIDSFVVRTCINNPLCFDLPAVDPDSGQVVTLMWNHGIPGGTFSLVGNPSLQDTISGAPGVPPQAQFCWTPTALGSYYFLVTVQDDACPYLGRSQFTVEIDVGPFATTAMPSGGGCATATLCALPLNGTAPYSFVWGGPGGLSGNPNVTDSCVTHTYPALGTYTYYLQVTDSNGCVTRDTGAHTVTVVMQVDAGPDITMCSGDTAQLGTPAIPTYTYTWSPTIGLNNPNLAQPTVTRGNPVNTPLVIPYIVTAMEQSIACTETDTVRITVLPDILTSTVTQPSCLGGSTGTATVNLIGGIQPFTYLWDTATGNQTTQTATGLPPGAYQVEIIDAAGCTARATAVVLQPSPLHAVASMTPVSCFGGNDGMASASATGGLGQYSYVWLPGNLTGSPVSGLVAGSYQVIATDTGGCADTTTILVTEPGPLQVTLASTPSTCALPFPNGTAAAQPSGGTPGYTYVWSTLPALTGATVTGLSPGTYTVTVTDANGCRIVGNTTVADIPPPIVTAGADVSACEGVGGATITASASNGSPGYWFVWTCATGNCGLSSINAASPTANPTTSQYYYVQVTDTNGCVSNVDSLWFEVLPQPIVNAGPDIILCGDSAPCRVLHPVISAAAGPYAYSWFPTTGLNAATILNPCARPDTTTAYTLVVTAGNGCTSDFTTTDTLSTVVVHVNPIPVADAGPDRESCAGDSIRLFGQGNNAGPLYSFEWSPATGVSSTTQPNPNVAPPSTTIYTLVVWSNGCPSYGDQVLVDVHTLPTVDAGPTREICLGESILLDAQAGGDSTATYSFQWTPAMLISDPGAEDPTVEPVATTTYFVQATSNYGCESPLDSVLVRLKPTPIAEAGPNLVVCAGGSIQLDGSYAYTTTDSAPDASQVYFLWTPSANLNNTTLLDPIANPTASGWYHLTVRHNTCVTEDSVLVTVVPGLGLTVSADTTTTCAGDSITLEATVGVSGAQFQWYPSGDVAAPAAAATQAAPTTSTTYTVVAAQGGCTDTASVAIEVIPTPTATFAHSESVGCPPLTVSLQQTALDGLAYSWDFGDGAAVSNLQQVAHTYASPGTYYARLTAIGPGGCRHTSDPLPITVVVPPVADFQADPDFPATLSLPVTEVHFTNNSTGASTCTWDFGDGSTSDVLHASHYFPAEGTYMVTLTATNDIGCVAAVTHGPFIVVAPELFIPNVFSPNGDGQNDRFLVEYNGSQPFILQVLDRWGTPLYQGRDKLEGWNGLHSSGAAVPAGVYYYRVVIGDKDYVGDLTLVR